MDSHLGLKQVAAPPAGKSKARPAAKSLHTREGPIWATVTIVAEHETVPKREGALRRFRVGYTTYSGIPAYLEYGIRLFKPCLEYVEYVFNMYRNTMQGIPYGNMEVSGLYRVQARVGTHWGRSGGRGPSVAGREGGVGETP